MGDTDRASYDRKCGISNRDITRDLIVSLQYIKISAFILRLSRRWVWRSTILGSKFEKIVQGLFCVPKHSPGFSVNISALTFHCPIPQFNHGWHTWITGRGISLLKSDT